MSTKKVNALEHFESQFGPMSAGLFIKSWREAEGHSQTGFARRLGLSKANLCDIEKGRKLLSPERAAKFARVLRVAEEILVKLSLQDQLRQAKLSYTVELRRAS